MDPHFLCLFILFIAQRFGCSAVVHSPQRPTAALSYSNPHGCPCTLSGALHGLHVLHGKVQNEDAWVLIVIKQPGVLLILIILLIIALYLNQSSFNQSSIQVFSTEVISLVHHRVI